MDKSVLEELIVKRATYRLVKEWDDFLEKVNGSTIGQRLQVGEKYLVITSNRLWSECIFNPSRKADNTNLKQVMEERLKEIVEEETKKVLSTVEDVLLLIKNNPGEPNVEF